MTSDEARRYFFCHLQKTAGTSLLLMLRRHFGERAVYPSRDDGGGVARMISVPHLLSRWRARQQEISLVTGHFPLCTRELLTGGSFSTFTVVREPVDRTLSFLRHHRWMRHSDRHRSLEEIYDTPLVFHGLIHNHMVKMLSLTPDEMTAGLMTRVRFTSAHLERAKEQLASMDAIGRQDQLETFCLVLRERMGFQLGDLVAVNRTEPAEASQAFRDRIANDNALDMELYQFACTLIASRPAAAPPRAQP